jgi:hypothetical protein
MTKEKKPSGFWAVFGSVDWPRALHQGATIIRELRGDDTAADSERARQFARRSLDAVKSAGRQAIGCRKPEACSCGFCREERGEE